MWSEAATRIGTLRIHGSGGQPLVLRLAVERQLAAAELRVPSAPPSSVLIVRRLEDPLPGRLRRRPRAVGTDPAWEREARKRLDSLYHTAARPADGPAPADAVAVRFHDESEMLASLCVDLARGQTAERWWWRTLMRQRPELARGPASLLAANANQMPAIFAELASRGQATSVLAALAEPQAATLLDSLAEAHVLGRLRRSSPSRKGIGRQGPPSTAAALPPWHAWLPPGLPAAPTRSHECLLGSALVLYHQPARARSPDFTRAIRAWWHPSRSGPPPFPVPKGRPRPAPGFDPGSSPTATRRDAANPTIENPGREPESPRTAAAPGASNPVMETQGFDPGPPQTTIDRRIEILRSTRPSLRDAEASPAVADPEPAPEPDPKPSPEPDAGPCAPISETPEEGLPTRLGGVLYLIHLMRDLDLPDSFEDDWGLASRVGAWGVLELLGRGLLGGAGADFDGDPMWTVLAELDGRPAGTPPGGDFVSAAPFRAPASWELPRGEPGEEAKLPAALAAWLAADLGRWLAAVLPGARHRLAAALNRPAGAPDLGRAVLEVPGRLYVTRTHVDLVAGLDAATVAVRRAGLDRDPGWAAEFGRVVSFHFE